MSEQPLPRLLPLIEQAPNEGVANALARLLIDDPANAEDGTRLTILILTGIQAFLDSGGCYEATELVWEPVIVARQMLKAYANDACNKAQEMREAAAVVKDVRGAEIYARVTELLAQHQQHINKKVDSAV